MSASTEPAPPLDACTVGVSPPGRFGVATFDERRQAMQRIADAGLDHVFFADHVSFKGGFGMDGMVQAAALSQLHPDLSVYIGVYLLALRHPVTVARQLVSLSEMAPGRVVLGVGVGGEDRHEMEVCGIDPRTRGRRTDECLAIIEGLFTGEPLTHRGEFYDLHEAHILPVPNPPIPITVGGRAEAALRRVARHGDGWLSVWRTADRFAEGVAFIDEAAAEIGRNRPFRHGLQLWCAAGATPGEARPWVQRRMEGFYKVPFERFERYVPYGTPEDIAEFLRPFLAAGCQNFNLTMCAATMEESVDASAEVKRLLTN